MESTTVAPTEEYYDEYYSYYDPLDGRDEAFGGNTDELVAGDQSNVQIITSAKTWDPKAEFIQNLVDTLQYLLPAAIGSIFIGLLLWIVFDLVRYVVVSCRTKRDAVSEKQAEDVSSQIELESVAKHGPQSKSNVNPSRPIGAKSKVVFSPNSRRASNWSSSVRILSVHKLHQSP